ncbi:YihY/virulence factor BrkB family protein [Kineosporiaceae bacterium SCSIO 59966]|nr:YihY/virulence factor BrkB family protein [Kineosporiaceae bacterium SCSIO 59966]
MSSVRPVPETVGLPGEELDLHDAGEVLHDHAGWPLLRESFTRFRFGDGFSHARGFGFQLALATVPMVIAMTGLAAAIGAEHVSEVVARTAVALSPAGSDEVVEQIVQGAQEQAGAGDEAPREEAGELALVLGLLVSFAAMTTAFAQLERGANRIYGTERDRPSLVKYVRAGVLTVVAGTPMTTGLLLIVAGRPFQDAVEQVYGWPDTVHLVFTVGRWPVGLLLLLLAVTVLFRFAPRRRQPGVSWLVLGASVTVLGWLAASGLLAVYVAADSFDGTYGPLTAVMALLIWAYLTGIALLGGVAVTAQAEARRAGQRDPRQPDSDGDGVLDGAGARQVSSGPPGAG